MREGQFREDLYYRIAVVMIEVPPLRARRGDIGLLVEHFLRKFSAAHHKRVPRLTGRAQELLLGAEWPGNVRQLENCIEQAVVLSEHDTVDVDVLPLAEAAGKRGDSAKPGLPAGLTLRDLEQQYILQTLDGVGGNRTQAARQLGISLRCLQYKLKAYRHAEALTPLGRERGRRIPHHASGLGAAGGVLPGRRALARSPAHADVLSGGPSGPPSACRAARTGVSSAAVTGVLPAPLSIPTTANPSRAVTFVTTSSRWASTSASSSSGFPSPRRARSFPPSRPTSAPRTSSSARSRP